ncbi:uncharacterized protein LOC144453645 [Glandiceps talaboti]
MSQFTVIAVCTIFTILICTVQTINAAPNKRALTSSRCFGSDPESSLFQNCYGYEFKKSYSSGTELTDILKNCRTTRSRATVCRLAYHIADLEERLAYVFTEQEKDGDN